MKEQLSSTELENIHGGIIIILDETDDGIIIIIDETEDGRAVRSLAARR